MILSDLRGYLNTKLRSYMILVHSLLCSLFVRLSFSLKGIKIGKRYRFFSRPVAVRIYQSRITIGNNCSFRSDFSSNLIGVNRKCIIATVKREAEISIGNNAGFSGTVIAAAGSIKIGNNVLCGANTTITDFDWHGIMPDKRQSLPDAKPVIIEDNVWIGLNSVVLKGVRIGKNSVIGANSLVTKDIPENVIAAGNPCRILKKIEPE